MYDLTISDVHTYYVVAGDKPLLVHNCGGVGDILRPGGELIGQAGSSSAIREVSGGLSDAQATFNQLTEGGTVISNSTYPGTLVRLASPMGERSEFGLRCPTAPTQRPRST
jgi:hypothetical protein